MLWCFLGNLGERKGQNPNIFLKRWCKWCGLRQLFGVSTGAAGRGTLAILLTLAKMNKIPSLCPSYCFALVGLPANVALFRVLRGFNWVYRLFVGVCIACVLCVACGAFVCVRG